MQKLFMPSKAECAFVSCFYFTDASAFAYYFLLKALASLLFMTHFIDTLICQFAGVNVLFHTSIIYFYQKQYI